MHIQRASNKRIQTDRACAQAADTKRQVVVNNSRHIFLSLVFSFAILFSDVFAAKSTEVKEQISSLLPGTALYPLGINDASNDQISVSRFGFRLEQSSNDYGTVVTVFDSKSGQLLWAHIVYGDFGPHTIELIDFDGDGRDDLWLLSGFEDVFASHLFMNRIDSDQFSLTSFVPGFASDEVYATLLDFNKDGYPEILVPGNKVLIDMWEVYNIADAQCFKLSKEIVELAKKEYSRLVGRFDFANFDYNMDSYPVHALFLNNKIQIISKYPENKIVTNKYADHVRWRLEVTKKRLSESSDSCKNVLSQRLE